MTNLFITKIAMRLFRLLGMLVCSIGFLGSLVFSLPVMMFIAFLKYILTGDANAEETIFWLVEFFENRLEELTVWEID